MTRTHYNLAFATIWRGIVILMKSWAVTLNRLLYDIIHGISKHWFFALMLTAAFAAMFVVMADSRAMYHHGEMVNYMLTQQIDSLKLVKGY